jgi:superfamily II DNA/RNA helicase
MVQELPVDSTIIVFCETKKSVDRVCDALAEKKIPNLPFYE